MDHGEYVSKTAAHYTEQWGADLKFGDFVKQNPDAAKAMPSRQLPWQSVFDRIRDEASQRTVRVYDAACGYGDIMNALTATPNPNGLRYFGMDLHGSLDDIARPANASLVQGDIIEIGDDGKVYVVDKEGDVVKVYNAYGTYSTTRESG